MTRHRSAWLVVKLVLALTFSCAVNAAGTSVFIKDINTTQDVSMPSDFFTANGLMYFLADDGDFGRELWVTDGTDGGTILLKDINPGSPSAFTEDSDPEFVVKDGLVFFGAFDNVNGLSLWKSDGTEQGTQRVKSFDRASVKLHEGTIQSLVTIGPIIYFVADEDDTGREIWKSDGTTAGTVLVKDIRVGTQGSVPLNLTAFNSKLYFSADDGSAGRELWVSDGTGMGTMRLKDIRPMSAGSHPDNLIVYNGSLYFSANDGVIGNELWVSDGTEMGTIPFLDIETTALVSSNPRNFTMFNGDLYFSAETIANGDELWKTNGTPMGTILAHDINTHSSGAADSRPSRLFVFQGELYFIADDGNRGPEIWKTNGTTLSLLKEINDASSFFPKFHTDGTNLYFTMRTAAHGLEPWVSNGTSSGTILLKDINPGSEGSSPEDYAFLGGHAYIGGFENDFEDLDVDSPVFVEQIELWRSNGTEPGTVLFKNINQGTRSSSPDWFTDLNGTLIFTANSKGSGEELWRSTGSSGGTVQVKDINTGAEGSDPESLISIGDLVYFQATDSSNGREIWRTDGTSDGTFLLRDINPGSAGSEINDDAEFVSLDDQTVFFPRINFDDGYAIWKTDGTVLGTSMFLDLNDAFEPNEFFRAGDKFYFSAPDASGELILWQSDGTLAQTTPLKKVSSFPFAGPFSFGTAGNLVYFFADDVGGVSLWKTDGTAVGTTMVKSNFDGVNESVNPLSLGSTLFFFANDDINGLELWKSDGTEAGTVMVKDIVSGGGLSGPSRNDFVATDDKLYFIVDDRVHGKEIWTSDGTEAGTFLLRDINGLPTDSDVDDMLVVGDKVYFEADDGVVGEEMWVTDGTVAGTKLYRDIRPGLLGSDPDELIVIDNTLFFEAEDSDHHDELWKILLDDPVCPAIKAVNGKVVSFCL